MKVYLDNSATTPVKPEVAEVMFDVIKNNYGNPSSVHTFGQEVKPIIDKARNQVAQLINAKPNEIYFTGSGTEADNWAIKGAAFALKDKGNHIITSKIEHHAVLHTCEYLEKQHGFDVTYLDVDDKGFISLQELADSIRPETILITIIYANNEIGTVEPIKEIAEIAKANKILFHTDAVQALGNIKIDVKELGIDMMSISGHKLYAPKGVGALYIRTGVKIDNLLHGGAQERKKRPGTENTAGIAAFGKACELAEANLDNHIQRVKTLRDRLIKGIVDKIPHTIVTGDLEKRLPTIASFCFRFIEGESLLLSCDMVGIAGSSGSACTSGELDPSHVLMSIGLTHEIAHGSLRLSLSDFTTEEEIDYVIEKLPEIVQRLRNMSPLYEAFLKGESK